jgi:hypothetical protein
MLPTLLLPLLLLSLSFTPPCLAITVYYTNLTTNTPTSLILSSVYATVGNLPSSYGRFNASIMWEESCHLDRDEIQGLKNIKSSITSTNARTLHAMTQQRSTTHCTQCSQQHTLRTTNTQLTRTQACNQTQTRDSSPNKTNTKIYSLKF